MEVKQNNCNIGYKIKNNKFNHLNKYCNNKNIISYWVPINSNNLNDSYAKLLNENNSIKFKNNILNCK